MSSLILKAGNQTFSPKAGPGLRTTGDDTFWGNAGGVADTTSGAVPTSYLSSTDSITGAGGANTLNSVLDGEATVDPLHLLDIETVNLAPGNMSAGGASQAISQTFNASSSSNIAILSVAGGLFAKSSTASPGAGAGLPFGDGEAAPGSTLVVTGIATSTAVGMKNSTKDALAFNDNLTVTFTGLTLSGPNIATLVLSANSGGTFNSTSGSGIGIKTLSIESATAANTVTIGTADTVLTAEIISGYAPLSLNNSDLGVTKINGSAATGNLNIVAGAVTGALSIRGGSGNDTLNASSTAVGVTMTDGNGTDKLIFNGGVSANVITAGSGTDTIQAGAASGGLTFITNPVIASNVTLTAGIDVLNNYGPGRTKIDLNGLTGSGWRIDTIAPTSLANALSTASSLLTAVNAVAGLVHTQSLTKEVVAFAYGGSEYIYQDATGATAVHAGDGLLQVTGAASTFRGSDLSLA